MCGKLWWGIILGCVAVMVGTGDDGDRITTGAAMMKGGGGQIPLPTAKAAFGICCW